MKKIILSIAALAIASVAMAQDTGARKAVQVAQIPGAAAGANTGESIQNGSSNAVQVRQAGTEQSTLTNQDGVGNLARVFQTGNVDGNEGQSGQLNLAEVEQTGYLNESTIAQEGDFNNAMIDQNNDAGEESLGNRAQIMQGTANQAENNDAAIEQDGQDNSAYTLQTFDNSDASTVQSGVGNTSEIVQNAGPEASLGQFAIVDQTGDGNQSRVDQDNADGSNARNVALTTQIGSNNQAEQLQSAEGAVGNTAQINQGTNGTIVVSSDAFNRFGEVTGFDSSVNNFLVEEDSESGVAFQNQSGDDNDAFIAQASSEEGSNNAAQIQDGNGNSAFISQSFFAAGGTDNVGRQLQTGDNNAATLNQDGSSHASLQDQWGTDNNAVTSQAGLHNNANTFQEGTANYGQTLQHGQDNVALLTQRAGQSYTIRQNEGVFTGVGGNQADILQEGPYGAGNQTDFIHVNPQGVTAPHQVGSFTLDPLYQN